MRGRALVSIVTPSLNMGAFLEETLSSVLEQDYPNVEYVVADGGSTDGTREILQRHAGRLTYVSEPDRGQADAINKGFERTRGEIFAFLNADDTLLPGAISAAVDAFAHNPDAGVVYGNAWYLSEDGARIQRYPVEEYDAGNLSRRCFICQPAAFIRREAFAKAGMLDASLHYSLDYDLWIRLARLAPMVKIEPFLATSRIHPNSKTISQMGAALSETIRTLRRHYGYVPCNWLYGYCHHLRTGQNIALEPPRFSPLSAVHAIALGARHNWRSPGRYLGDIARATPPALATVARRISKPLLPVAVTRVVRGLSKPVLPRIGVLKQYAPRPLRVPRAPDRAPDDSKLPTISIVTPSYQHGRFLRDTIESVLNQSYPPLEYFVQDGGSTDHSLSILAEFEHRLTGWLSEPDRGQAHAINLAFARTRGEIMGWLNSDDILLPGTLQRVAAYFRQHPDVSVVYGNRIMIDEQGMEIGRWILPEHDAEILRWTDYIPQETLFWRRSAWEAAGGALDESFQFALDWDLLLRFQDTGARFARLPHFFGAFRVHHLQKTSAHMDSVGAKEISALRLRHLGIDPSPEEVYWRTKAYLSRHVAEHAKVSLRDWIDERLSLK